MLDSVSIEKVFCHSGLLTGDGLVCLSQKLSEKTVNWTLGSDWCAIVALSKSLISDCTVPASVVRRVQKTATIYRTRPFATRFSSVLRMRYGME